MRAAGRHVGGPGGEGHRARAVEPLRRPGQEDQPGVVAQRRRAVERQAVGHPQHLVVLDVQADPHAHAVQRALARDLHRQPARADHP